MTKFTITAVIVLIKALTPRQINGRDVTHRVYLKDSNDSIAKAQEAMSEYTNGQGNPVSAFGYNPDTKQYVMDVNETTLFAMNSEGVDNDFFAAACRGAKYKADVELRLAGDTVEGRKGEKIAITVNHHNISNPVVKLTGAALSPIQMQSLQLKMIARETVTSMRAAVPTDDFDNDDESETSDKDDKDEVFVSKLQRKPNQSKADFNAAVAAEKEEWEASHTTV